MTKKLIVKAQHAFMLVPFHKNRPRFAANALMVNDSCTGDKKDLPAFLAKTHAPVEIFAVHEIAFIHNSDFIHSPASDQHT